MPGRIRPDNFYARSVRRVLSSPRFGATMGLYQTCPSAGGARSPARSSSLNDVNAGRLSVGSKASPVEGANGLDEFDTSSANAFTDMTEWPTDAPPGSRELYSVASPFEVKRCARFS